MVLHSPTEQKIQRVRYIPSGDEMGTFEFLLETVIKEVEQFTNKYSDVPPEEELLRWLYFQTTTDLAVIEVTHNHMEAMGHITGNLIEKGSCQVFCKKCEQFLPPSSIIQEEWHYDHGFLDAGGGRRFLCKQGHELLKVHDWIS